MVRTIASTLPGWPFDIGRSWLITVAGVDALAVRVIVAGLIAITVGGLAIAGMATAGVVVPAGWWPAAVSLAAVASASALVVCFDPQLVLGLGMDGVLLWVAASRAWTP